MMPLADNGPGASERVVPRKEIRAAQFFESCLRAPAHAVINIKNVRQESLKPQTKRRSIPLATRSRKNEAPIALCLHRLFNRNSDSNRCADHRIVAHADQAHHFHVRGHGG